MTWLAPVAVALLVLLYVVSPIDFIPDMARPWGLLDDLAVVLLALWWFQNRRARMQREPQPDASSRNPYAVLGLPHGASPEEVTRAYREQMKLYHPDRVADLGEELQRLAHEKTIEIQQAYEELSKA